MPSSSVLNVVALLLIICFVSLTSSENGEPFGMISRVQTYCEVAAMTTGTRLADSFNSYDEATEWDARMNHDFLTEHLGFSYWAGSGTWGSHGLTAEKQHAPTLHRRGGWSGHKNVSESAYWALENQWVYMMGDSTERQIWAAFVQPFHANDFVANSKEWTRENCARQFPHRKEHPPGGYFPEEGWGGKCGNNEVTCDMAGFGPEGKITFDWKVRFVLVVYRLTSGCIKIADFACLVVYTTVPISTLHGKIMTSGCLDWMGNGATTRVFVDRTS
jgi:hypothetical protein